MVATEIKFMLSNELFFFPHHKFETAAKSTEFQKQSTDNSNFDCICFV